MGIDITLRGLARRIFGSPAHDRLADAIDEAWLDLDREVQSGNSDVLTESWARSAYARLLRAEAHLTSGQFDRGWTMVLSGQRAILSNPNNLGRVERTAIALRREVHKITGWRAKAIEDLICAPDGALIAVCAKDLMRVIDAVALRDDSSQNTWFKIVLRRQHLLSLFFLVWLSLILCLILSWLRILPGFLGDVRQVSAVVLFGVLGAAVSVGQSLVAEDVSARIPAQQIGSFLVWMRPGIGAAAALVVLALLHANQQFHIIGQNATDTAVITVFSFIAGYSERFIVGAIERISDSTSKASS